MRRFRGAETWEVDTKVKQPDPDLQLIFTEPNRVQYRAEYSGTVKPGCGPEVGSYQGIETLDTPSFKRGETSDLVIKGNTFHTLLYIFVQGKVSSTYNGVTDFVNTANTSTLSD